MVLSYICCKYKVWYNTAEQGASSENDSRSASQYFSLFKSKMGADKSLARPGRKEATATEDFDVHITYL
jgi:hypothetical protein